MKLEAELMKIDGEYREACRRAKPKDRRVAYEEALWKAYDAIARQVTRKDPSDEALTKTIPERVLEEAFRLGWIKRPEEPHSPRGVNVPRRPRRAWLGDTSGWLDEVRERIETSYGSRWRDAVHRATQEPLPLSSQSTIKVAGTEVLVSWWENVWLPIFAGRIQAWRARLMSAQPSKADREKTFPRRAEWLRARLLERGWGERELADHAAVAEKTVRRILRGLPVTHKSLSAIVDGLNRHPRGLRVSADMVPGD